MKIIHLISGGDAGGAKTHVLTLLRELHQTQQVLLVCFIEGPFAQEARDLGIPTRVLGQKDPLRLRRELLRCIRQGGFELLHCHGAKANVYASWIRRDLRIPVISTVHSDPRLDYLGRPLANATYGVMNRISMRRRDGWVAVSDSMKELLIDRGYDADRIQPIYNGIVFSEPLPCVPRREYLEGLGVSWPEDGVIFGIAARIASVKDLPTLVRAFAQTVRQAPNARLLIAGDGEQRAEVEALARRLCPPDTVCFAGWQQDMNSFYHAVDVNMLSSVSETFPYAITEGARMHCATISTAVGGVPKVIVDGETGFLVEVGNDGQMSARMTELARDSRLRAKLGTALYEKVRREFSSEAMAQHQLQIYETVLRRYSQCQKGRYGAVICGAYGRGNAGDDAILTTMIRQLREQDPSLPVCVMSRRPKKTQKMTGVSAIPIFSPWRSHQVMKRSRLYISGGGSLIQNITSNRSLLFYLHSIRQAKRCGCQVMMYGCGIGPISGKRYEKKVEKTLNRSVDLITLRDPESREALERFGVHRPCILVTADPAMEMQADRSAARRYRSANGMKPEEKYCMFALRPWQGCGQKLGEIAKAAEYVWERHGLIPVFFSFEQNRDQEIAQQAAALVQAPCKLLPPMKNGAEICGLLAEMELVVGMRLHALIFSCSQNTRVVGISYDPKVSGFLHYAGSGACLELEELTAERLCAQIDQALAEGPPHRVEALKCLSKENGRLAGELLRS